MGINHLVILALFFSVGPIFSVIGVFVRKVWLTIIAIVASLAIVMTASMTYMGMVFNPIAVIPLWVNVAVSVLSFLLILGSKVAPKSQA